MTKKDKKPGRPPENIIRPIKDTPERLVQAIMLGEPKKIWKYKKQS